MISTHDAVPGRAPVISTHDAGTVAGRAAVISTRDAGTVPGRAAVISTHVLDTSAGRPAAGVPVALERAGGEVVARAVTDSDGRVGSFGEVAAGAYRLVFDTAAHSQFFPRVSVDFVVGEERLHVPLLLNPFGYSTYRGS